MNGHMYDARLGRFLSPDNFVQAPDFSQNLNRYSYALNNPLVFTDPSGNYNFKVNQPTQQELLSGYISMFATAAIGYFFPPLAIVEGGAFGSMLGYAVPGAISRFIGGFIGSSTSSWIYGGSLSAGLGSGSVAGMYGMFNGFEMGASEGLSQYYSRPLNMERNSYPNNEAIWLPEVEVVSGTGKIKGGVPSWWGKFDGSADRDELQYLYGWSVDITIAAAVGYTVEFGEIYDPNTGQTQQFISYGPAFGAEATAGVNAIIIFPKDNFKFSDLQGTSWGMSGSGLFGVISGSLSGNSTPGYSGGTQFDSYYMIKVGLGPGAGFNNTPESNTHFINWIPSRLWWY